MNELRQQITEATINAIRSVDHIRFFKTERGYQGSLYSALQKELRARGIFKGDFIPEIEYQKTQQRHGTSQRPDIILHIPTEASGEAVDKNNIAVWALKLRATEKKAKKDFNRLDIMFGVLKYQMGFFINIDSERHYYNSYTGDYKDRLTAFCAKLDKGKVVCEFEPKLP